MANYEFIDNGKSFNINFNNQEYTAGKTDVELVVIDSTVNKVLEIRSSAAKFTSIRVDVSKDTITGVGSGSPTASLLRDALEVIFFLEDTSEFSEFNKQDFSVLNHSFDVDREDYNKYFSIEPTQDYTVNLPDLAYVDPRVIYKFKNLKNSFVKGTFSPLTGQYIEGQPHFFLYGKGFLSIRKKEVEGVFSWSINDVSSLFDHLGYGRTKEIQFNNHNGPYQVVHNLSYRPIVEVELTDGEGGFSDIEVDIDHSQTNDLFIVNLEGINSGFIRYV